MPKPRRKRRTLILIGLIAVLSSVVTLVVLALDEPAVPQDAQLATGTPIPEALVYHVVPDQSQLRVTVDSQFGAIVGGYAMGAGTVALSAGDGGWYVIANLTFDARTLDIGNEQLNAIMRRALEVERYPDGIFVATSRASVPDFDAARAVELVGQLELHGQVRDYTIPTTVTRDGDTLTLRAQIVIDAGAFGVNIPALIADDDLDADLRVTARRQSPVPSTVE